MSSWLKINDFEAQIVDLPDGRTTVQARQPKSWRYVLGMTSALNITLHKNGDQPMVETGAGSWAEKVAVGAVGIFILHPLLITMAYGVWKQSQLPEKVFEVTEQFIKESQRPAGATRIPVGPSSEPASDAAVLEMATTASSTAESTSKSAFEERICASCGQATGKEAKYCDQCGNSLEPGEIKID
jgi:ribosomal protein L40E